MSALVTIRPGTEDASEPLLLSGVLLKPVPRRSLLVASAAVHGLALALVPPLLQALSGIAITRPLPPIYKVEIMRLRLPDKIYAPSAPSHREEQSKAEKPADTRPSGPGAHAPESRPRRQASNSRPLELPVTRHVSEQEPVILQPDQAPLPKIILPVSPPVAFWTKASQPVPRPRAIIPGRVQTTSVTPNLDAPPVLGPPTALPVASDVAVALAAAQSTPKLPLPSSTTNPIRVRGKSDAEIASFDVPGSDPINLIYLAADATTQKQIEIPRGMQNSPASKADGGSGMAASPSENSNTQSIANSAAAHDPAPSPPSAAAGTAPATGAAAARPTLDNSRNAIATGNSPSSRTAAVDSGPSGVAAGSSPSSKTSTTTAMGTSANATEPAAIHAAAPTGTHAPERAPSTSAGVIRMANPVNGNFDVVILQSVARDDMPDIGGALSGNPVYTVYLKVGDEREWLLEYCIPSNVTRSSPYQVNIDDSGAVSAPYPVTTVIPKNVVDLPHPKHIVLHGLLSIAGVFREITGPDTDSPLVREVLPLLREWQFRPALRDRVPVEVEVLLIIPARS